MAISYKIIMRSTVMTQNRMNNPGSKRLCNWLKKSMLSSLFKILLPSLGGEDTPPNSSPPQGERIKVRGIYYYTNGG